MKRLIRRLSIGTMLLVYAALSAQTYVPQTPVRTYAQKLVDLVLAANPKMMIFSIHALPQGSNQYAIVASNAPQLLGKTSDAEDLRVIHEEASFVKPAIPEGAFEVYVPLHDVTGKTIGALGMKYRGLSSDKQVLLAAALVVRDQLQKVIPAIDTLYDKFFFTAGPNDTLAMQLLARELIRHPDLWVLAFHCTPPGESVNKLIAINYLKLMNEPSEPSEEVLAKNGHSTFEAIPSTHRTETHVDMRDQQGNLIGTLATVYLYNNDEDLATILGRTQDIRDELARDIPSLTALVAPVK